MGRIDRSSGKAKWTLVFAIFIVLVFSFEIFEVFWVQSGSSKGGGAWACCGVTPGQGSSTSTPGTPTTPPHTPTGSPSPSPTSTEPVSLISGNYDRDVLLFSFPSRGMATVIKAHCNTQETTEGIMGQGWSHTFNVWLARMSDDSRVIVWGDRKREKYTPNGTGGFNPPMGNFDTLTFNQTDGSYTLTTKYGTQYLFIPASPGNIKMALLSTVKDRNGNTITLSYTSGQLTTLTDTAGRIFTFSYLNGKLSGIQDPAGRTVSFTYNTDNLLSKITDPMGNSTQYAYNQQRKLSSITDAKGQIFFTQQYDDMNFPRAISQNYGGQINNIEYDANNSLAREATNGKVTTYYYNPVTGFQTNVVDPLGRITQTAYDSAGNMIILTDPKGLITNFSYDSKGNVTQITQPMNIITKFTYEPTFSNILSATDPNNFISNFTYDANGNMLTGTNPLNKTTSFAYDAYGQLTRITNARSFSTNFSYDATGNLTSTTDALNNAWNFTYDNRGNPLTATDPLNHTVTSTFNLNNQVLTIADPMNYTTTFTYDVNKKLLTVTDANGKISSYEYNILDMVTKVTNPLNQSAIYAYNNDLLLSSITNPRGLITSFTYDNAGRLISVTDPLNRITSFGYDANSNITSRTDGKGNVVQFFYDDINRLTKKSFPDLTSIQFSYDLGSRSTQMTDIDGRITNYSYDAANRLTSVTGYPPTINYGYDDVGNLTSFTDLGPGNSTAYSYDALNRLTSVNFNGKIFNYSYDAASRLTSKSYSNGITTNYQYNNANWLTLVSHMNGLNPLMSFQYTFDNVGNRLTKLQTLPQGTFSWQYAYDSLYRLTTETYPDNHAVTYTYDANGNRLTRTENAVTINSTYDAADQLLTAGSLTFVWDGNGNLIQKTNGTATTNFAYDYENHLKQVTFPNASTESYRYNGDGLRIAKIPSSSPQINYYLSGSDVWREESSPGGPPSTDYILAGSMAGPLGFKQPGSPNPVYHYSLTDGQGSIMGLTDDAGTITDQYQYEAWGNPANLPNPPPNQTYNPYHYTGQQVDPSTGLHYLRNRYYDAQAGRFITDDPIGFEGGLNLFAYCDNDPVNLIDPEGLRPGDKFPSEIAAAKDAERYINKKSVEQNKEYAGWTVKNRDRTYSYTVARTSNNPEEVPVPPKPANGVSIYHTHGSWDPNYDNENFSMEGGDLDAARQAGAKAVYVATPEGVIKKLDPRTRSVTSIGRAPTLPHQKQFYNYFYRSLIKPFGIQKIFRMPGILRKPKK
ncbi:MAG: DUF4329 domain-containing protein [Firmicutes bacterium]|nr:DUF4329 domain-containing protein [Bacillota bacterium]